MNNFRVLIIYFSHSSQTRKLIQSFASGLEGKGVDIFWQQLETKNKIPFPLGSVLATFRMMVETFFRKRFEIKTIEQDISDNWDMIILAGPTWSYNPSGPILKFFDLYGNQFAGKKILPFISCRGYWRVHSWLLKNMLAKKKAKVLNPVVFLHTGPEPWRTIGVFLKLAGKVPESGKTWISKYYSKFGHTREQVAYASELGAMFADALESENRLLQQRPTVIGEIKGKD